MISYDLNARNGASLSSPPPADLDDVIAAFRFGWALAELRGRYRPDVSHLEDEAAGPRVKRIQHALPLANERSPKEQRIEVSKAVTGLSKELKLDFPDEHEVTCGEALGRFTYTLDQQPQNQKAWDDLSEGFYNWDKRVQDALVLKPRLSAAYQLGRGLAETYWELDPNVDGADDARCWTVVLGDGRRQTIKRLVARLASYIEPWTLPAVTISLDSWGEVAAAKPWREQADARLLLFKQGLLWRDLVRGERRAEDLTTGESMFGRVGVIWPVVRSFWPQIVIGVVAVVGLILGASGLAAHAGNTKTATILSILGGLGLTTASLYARAKASATSLIDVLRKAFEEDRVGQAATIRPKAPFKTRARPERVLAAAARRLGRAGEASGRKTQESAES